MAIASRPRRLDPAAELRERIAEKAAGNRRLLQENQKLQAELRRAMSEAAIADRLHHAHIEGRVRASGASAPAGFAEGFSWNTSPAALGSTSPAPEIRPAGEEADSIAPALSELRQRVAEAEASAHRAADEAQVLKDRLCTDGEFDALKSEVAKMRMLVEKLDKAPLPTSTVISAKLAENVPEERRVDNANVLKSDSSFEMLSSVRELARAETKKALESRLASLNRELGNLQASASGQHTPSSATPTDRRRQRRLQQANVLAAGLHQELKRRPGSGMVSPRSIVSGSSVRGAASSVVSPVTVRSNISGTPSMVSSASKAFDNFRVQRLDRGIQQLSRRFALRAGMR